MKTAADAWSLFKPGDRVALHGAGGEPRGALAALEADPELGRGLEFVGIWLPGINDIDPSAIAPDSTAEVIFINPPLRQGWEAGRVKLQPINYWHSEKWISSHARLDGAILQVSPPRDGVVTAGIACDFDQALLRGAKTVVGEVNPNMPTPPHAPKIPVERFAMLTEAHTELPSYSAGSLPPDLKAIAARIAAMIEPDDTVQVGVGKAASALMEALVDHRGLNYHAGLIIEEFAPLLEAGVFSGNITTGTIIGSRDLYDRVAEDPRIRFKGVDFTHHPGVIAAIPRFVSVNSALSVDLFGQATQEWLGGRQISGQGGAGDFARAARASDGGRHVIAMPATARRGSESRIRLRLEPDGLVTLPRVDAEIVVTEFGVADLRWKDVDARAAALIAVAAPEFRDGLANAWDEMRRTM
ncbi:acetyl-CoA hydrolase/transferase C-terminal domain-containing protein [Albimonas sp. CAU 1670]|uniref:acetyl-CoA hydrolase/transferase C-terminal domain-containing protein n=1 Tax=Albimonas sp. CAU 1670 TaxID=3032599 RepID=UPI0023DBD8E6|nr:acetyl-CoA hydrolase/transferase C-terminal domain-containing protein [Albimonas sp. CAU 1670]MDF2232435.1 acetyl-CoA hydrolase/transferase C-terminal domain-containing protein [Albimonas sp. CAU 1670]